MTSVRVLISGRVYHVAQCAGSHDLAGLYTALTKFLYAQRLYCTTYEDLC